VAVAVAVAVLVLSGAVWFAFRTSKPDQRAGRSSRSRQEEVGTEIRSAVETGRVQPPPGLADIAVASVTPATPPRSAAGATSAAIVSPEIMAIQAAIIKDPVRAEQLIYADRKRFPDSPFSDERDALLVSALNNQQRRWDAKVEARRYLRAHVNGRYTDFVLRTTGIEPN